MNKKILSIAIVLTIVFAVFAESFVPTAGSSSEFSDCEPIDVGPRLRKSVAPVDMGEPLTGQDITHTITLATS